MSSDDILSKPFFEFKGSGKIVFNDDGLSADVNFIIKTLQNGKTVGNLDFITFHLLIENKFSQMKKFSLHGKWNDNNGSIIATGCYLVSLSSPQQIINSKITISGAKGEFKTDDVIFFPEALDNKPEKKLLIQFGIINFHKTWRVDVDTKLGKLVLANYHGIDERVSAMRSYNIPLITSAIDIFPSRINFNTVRDVVNESIDIVQDFLKVTSLSELSWHDWAFVDVYEKIEDTQDGKLIFRKLSNPKIKSPKSYSLTPIVYSNEFMKTAWGGYCKELDDIYGFNAALEWLIESVIPDISETKFLAATTCFEMLMDKFSSQNETEFILDYETFKEFYAVMREHASSELKARDIEATLRSVLYNALGGMNRRSFVDKGKTLTDYWGILYDDIGKTLYEIKDVRNDITHKGKYNKEGEEGLTDVIKAYKGLMTILTRIFLAMLGYDKYYQDPFMEGKWIEFSSVCSKN